MDTKIDAPGEGKNRETVPSALVLEEFDHGSILSSAVSEISG